MGKSELVNKEKTLGKKLINDYIKLIIIGMALISMLAMAGCSSSSKESAANTNSEASTSSNSSKSSDSSNSNKESKSADSKTATADIVPGIEINKADISDKVKFYPYESNGIKMEVLALKAKDGTIRTALNTCQVCYASGKGYYIQEGDELVCQNCGNRFASNMVGKTKGGCNPVPISDTSKIDDGSKITIDKNYLDKNKAYFSNWKA
jgi:outer membrane murein-binding lipoprotein Lpp